MNLRRLLSTSTLVAAALLTGVAATDTLQAQTPATVDSAIQSVGEVQPAVQGVTAPENESEVPAPPLPAAETEATGFMAAVDRAMGRVNAVISSVFFFDIAFWTEDYSIPLAVFWLVLGAIYFTIRMGFINFRAFRHAIQVVQGKYTNPDDEGEVTHFQALAAALSATVGLGNIAGVAIAISIGGPGATFWLIVAGFLGMSSKFAECTLGQEYRQTRSDGRIMGGAMYYLSNGLSEIGMPRLGKVLAVMFAILCIGGSLGGGNSFQVNQSMGALSESIPFLVTYPWAYGLFMAILVGIVIIGGIRRIASVADKIVPAMAAVYILGCLVVIFTNMDAVPSAMQAIFAQAFTPEAGYGGFIGVLVVGFQRAAFSNEAGVGSAAIAHSAAKTEYPVREGIVALLEPFIDTVVICTMTALVIVVSGAYNNPEYADLVASNNGATLTSRAFGEHITWFPYILSAAVFLFAFSTMISWSYYGERCWAWLFGDGSSQVYRLLFVTFVFLGSIITATNVLDFGDLMILGMAFPNVLGVVLLSGRVRAALDSYWGKYKRGELKRYDTSARRAA
jgi:AGCS family alanine or glycine:cation symporter